jgi:hypothetical protein
MSSSNKRGKSKERLNKLLHKRQGLNITFAAFISLTSLTLADIMKKR